jgi:hypothetical protein
MHRRISYFMGFVCIMLAFPAMSQERNRTILAVFAHADDEGSVGPLLARYAREKVDVYLVIVTRGETFAPQTNLSPGEEIAKLRAEEARCAADALSNYIRTSGKVASTCVPGSDRLRAKTCSRFLLKVTTKST